MLGQAYLMLFGMYLIHVAPNDERQGFDGKLRTDRRFGV